MGENNYSTFDYSLPFRKVQPFGQVNLNPNSAKTSAFANNFANPSTDSSSSDFLGMGKDKWGNIGTGVNALSGLASMYAGLKGLGLAEEQMNFNKDMANKQYSMAKDAYDRNVARAESVGSQMAAGKVNWG